MTEQTQDKPHLSYSQINTYCTCPLKYRFHYIDQIEPPFTAAPLAFGSAIHEAVGAFYQSCLEGEPLSAGQLHDVYRQAWKSHYEEYKKRIRSHIAYIIDEIDPKYHEQTMEFVMKSIQQA